MQQNFEKENNGNEDYKRSEYGITMENKNDKSKLKLIE